MTDIPQDLVEKVTHAICEAECISPEDCLIGHDGYGNVYYPRVNGKPVLMYKIRQESARAAIQTLIDEGWKGPEKPRLLADIS